MGLLMVALAMAVAAPAMARELASSCAFSAARISRSDLLQGVGAVRPLFGGLKRREPLAPETSS